MPQFVVLAPYLNVWWVLQVNGVVAQRIMEAPTEAAAHRMADLLNRNGMEDVPLVEGGS